MIRIPKQTPAHDETDPAGETIRAIRNWPDSELVRLAHHLAGELTGRRLLTPATLPVVLLPYATVRTPQLPFAHHS